jgi:hypothetical protein
MFAPAVILRGGDSQPGSPHSHCTRRSTDSGGNFVIRHFAE